MIRYDLGLIGAHTTFAVETGLFYKIDESVIATQSTFTAHKMLHKDDAIQDRKSMIFQVENSISII